MLHDLYHELHSLFEYKIPTSFYYQYTYLFYLSPLFSRFFFILTDNPISLSLSPINPVVLLGETFLLWTFFTPCSVLLQASRCTSYDTRITYRYRLDRSTLTSTPVSCLSPRHTESLPAHAFPASTPVFPVQCVLDSPLPSPKAHIILDTSWCPLEFGPLLDQLSPKFFQRG